MEWELENKEVLNTKIRLFKYFLSSSQACGKQGSKKSL